MTYLETFAISFLTFGLGWFTRAWYWQVLYSNRVAEMIREEGKPASAELTDLIRRAKEEWE